MLSDDERHKLRTTAASLDFLLAGGAVDQRTPIDLSDLRVDGAERLLYELTATFAQFPNVLAAALEAGRIRAAIGVDEQMRREFGDEAALPRSLIFELQTRLNERVGEVESAELSWRSDGGTFKQALAMYARRARIAAGDDAAPAAPGPAPRGPASGRTVSTRPAASRTAAKRRSG